MRTHRTLIFTAWLWTLLITSYMHRWLSKEMMGALILKVLSWRQISHTLMLPQLYWIKEVLSPRLLIWCHPMFLVGTREPVSWVLASKQLTMRAPILQITSTWWYGLKKWLQPMINMKAIGLIFYVPEILTYFQHIDNRQQPTLSCLTPLTRLCG